MTRDRSLLALLAGWMLLAVAAIWLRPLWPVDETRYVSVAWEMWLRGDFLVPYINGEPYSHKPPLLFWIIHAGWMLFGVNDWWPRLVGPLFAFAAVPLLLRMEGLLWGGKQTTDSAWVLFGTAMFASFVTLTMFDLLLMLCAIVGIIGVLYLSKGERSRGILWLGAGIGLGVLAKGPVILLHVLPVAVVAPWWMPGLKGRLARWYGDLGLGLLLGVAIALAWAAPAAWLGGEEYRRAILWGQTAGRVSESFAHREPFWHYLPLLPAILFPWFVLPRFWAGLREITKEQGTRFLAAWLVLVLLGFSLVSGKQAKYLVPLLPAFALLAGRALAAARKRPALWEVLPSLLGFLVVPGFFALLRMHPQLLRAPEWVAEIPLWPVVLGAVLALLPAFFARRETGVQMRVLAFTTLGTAAVIVAGIAPAFAPFADPGPTARYLAELEARKVPVAHLGKYHAQYNFAGRLRRPIDILGHHELRAWAAAHPDGRVIVVERHPSALPKARQGQEAVYQVRYRGAWLEIWPVEQFLRAHPELG